MEKRKFVIDVEMEGIIDREQCAAPVEVLQYPIPLPIPLPGEEDSGVDSPPPQPSSPPPPPPQAHALLGDPIAYMHQGGVDSVQSVRFFTPSLATFSQVLERLPGFVQNRTVIWIQRSSQLDVDALYFDINRDEWVNVRQLPGTPEWLFMSESINGNLEFRDIDDLRQHARSWPIPPGGYRDYKLVITRTNKALVRVYN